MNKSLTDFRKIAKSKVENDWSKLIKKNINSIHLQEVWLRRVAQKFKGYHGHWMIGWCRIMKGTIRKVRHEELLLTSTRHRKPPCHHHGWSISINDIPSFLIINSLFSPEFFYRLRPEKFNLVRLSNASSLASHLCNFLEIVKFINCNESWKLGPR